MNCSPAQNRPEARICAAYALPALPLAGLALPLYVIVPTFYSDVIGLQIAAVGAVLLLIRILDAFTDPLFGWLADSFPYPGGFEPTATVGPAALDALSILYAWLPILPKVIAIGQMWNFPLGEAEQQELRRRKIADR